MCIGRCSGKKSTKVGRWQQICDEGSSENNEDVVAATARDEPRRAWRGAWRGAWLTLDDTRFPADSGSIMRGQDLKRQVLEECISMDIH